MGQEDAGEAQKPETAEEHGHGVDLQYESQAATLRRMIKCLTIILKND